MYVHFSFLPSQELISSDQIFSAITAHTPMLALALACRLNQTKLYVSISLKPGTHAGQTSLTNPNALKSAHQPYKFHKYLPTGYKGGFIFPLVTITF